MKKTSIIFLISAVVLMIAGVILMNTGVKKANEQNIRLFKQYHDANGNLVETVEFDADSAAKINIDLSNTNVRIIGNSEKSYYEIVNFNAIDYTSYFNNRALSIENDLISSLINRAEGGTISFNGIRDYLRTNRSKDEKSVNIYLSQDSTVKIFDIKIKNGDIMISDLDLICDFYIEAANANVTFEKTPKISLLNAKIKKGNILLTDLTISDADILIDNGDLSLTTPIENLYSFELESETGTIKFFGESHKGLFSFAEDDFDKHFKAHVGVGNISIQNPIDIENTHEQTVEEITQSELS